MTVLRIPAPRNPAQTTRHLEQHHRDLAGLDGTDAEKAMWHHADHVRCGADERHRHDDGGIDE